MTGAVTTLKTVRVGRRGKVVETFPTHLSLPVQVYVVIAKVLYVSMLRYICVEVIRAEVGAITYKYLLLIVTV